MRAAAIAVATLGLAWVVTAASDEGGLPWGERAGRALPFAPVCAAVGACLALAPGRARGEDIALEAVGRSPFERHAGAIAGGAGVALAAALAIALVHAVDVRGFFPRPDARVTWSWSGAAFESADGAWRIEADGAPTALSAGAGRDAEAPLRVAPSGPSDVPRAGRVSAAVATALLGVALPMLGARARRRTAGRDLFVVAATALATVLAFQAAAAARAPALLAAVPAVFLLAAAATLYRLKPWLRAKSPR